MMKQRKRLMADLKSELMSQTLLSEGVKIKVNDNPFLTERATVLYNRLLFDKKSKGFSQ